MTWAKVVEGPLLLNVPERVAEAGNFRDSDDKPLTGIYRLREQEREKKLLLSNGFAFFGWQYPSLDLVFGSPLVNDLNLYCCADGLEWEESGRRMTSDEFSVSRVAAGLKPFGVCLLPPGERHEAILERYSAGIGKYSLAVQPTYYENVGQFEVTLSRRGPFGELFDLGKFSQDWRRLIEASPKTGPVEGELDQAMDILHGKRVEDFGTGYDHKNPPSLAHMIVVGLLFGYPLGTTAGMFFSPPKLPDTPK